QYEALRGGSCSRPAQTSLIDRGREIKSAWPIRPATRRWMTGPQRPFVQATNDGDEHLIANGILPLHAPHDHGHVAYADAHDAFRFRGLHGVRHSRGHARVR